LRQTPSGHGAYPYETAIERSILATHPTVQLPTFPALENAFI
jgi:hypothetical protein